MSRPPARKTAKTKAAKKTKATAVKKRVVPVVVPKPVAVPVAEVKPQAGTGGTHPLARWFEAVSALVGATAAGASGGRVARICKQMQLAGLDPAELRRLPQVIATFAPWRKVIDISAVQACWPWLKDPPAEASASRLGLMFQAVQENGGKPPF